MKPLIILFTILALMWSIDKYLSEQPEPVKVDEPYKVYGDSTCHCKICSERFQIHEL